MFASRIGALLAVLVVLAGCARGTSPDEAGMRAWVDERGQVRYSPVAREEPESDNRDESSENRDEPSDHQTGRPADEDTPDDPVYNLENFPDASQVIEEEELYYTWRDAEGRVHNTPYSLSEEKIARVSRPEKKQTASSARITRKGDAEVADYNPSSGVKRILGLEGAGGGRLAAFSRQCCSELPRLDTQRLAIERGVGVRLNDDSAVHRFSSGESRFALIRLPEVSSETLLRVRSFIRDGAFLPSLAFLDGDFEPVRLVTDITFDFSPETWSRYGFLEAFIPLDDQGKERWLVVFTRESDLEATTSFVDEAGRTTTIEHQGTGSLELTIP